MEDYTLTCQDEQRRTAIRKENRRRREAGQTRYVNGLDYLEVGEDCLEPGKDECTLTVYFIDKAPENIEPGNVRIEGGRRIRDIQVVGLEVQPAEDPDLDDGMKVVVARRGDFSPYTLRVVRLDEQGRPTDKPMRGFDPCYAELEFSFKVDCPSDLDCRTQEVCTPPRRDEPEINYLAKDYASFRQLILDRLALIMPDWQERHVPNIGIALVEVLAYVGDYLSYYQDAVATEAYLETARQRMSVRRHARLVDYRLHEGCNARVWVCVHTSQDLTLDPDDIAFIAHHAESPNGSATLELDDLLAVSDGRHEIFEPLVEPGAQIDLYREHSKIPFYTWGNANCCLPRGATTATLRDKWTKAPDDEGTAQQRSYEEKTPTQPKLERSLHLKVGDVLLFEEILGPRTGNPADRDLEHRHAVRLTRVDLGEDPLFAQRVPGTEREYPIPVVEIEWAREDKLPFPLCLSATGLPPACESIEDVSVARGNVVLADHGRTLPPERLETVPEAEVIVRCEDECHPPEAVAKPRRFRPCLQEGPLTFGLPFVAGEPASNTIRKGLAPRELASLVREAMPEIKELTGTRLTPGGVVAQSWTPRHDLLESQSEDRHFVVEVDNEGRARLRFGDGELGWMPEAGTTFEATYRVGNGPAGNVGADAITHIVFWRNPVSGVLLRPRNPLAARGGTAPEPLAEARSFAPHVFRTEIQRAITADDYARLAERHPEVARAAAELRWTGSWYEAQVAIDPRGETEADDALLDEIERHLCPYRRIGHDLAVVRARYVPLDIEMKVCVHPEYLRGHVKAALLDLFSNRTLPDGRLGFFHPDNLSFGDSVYLSRLVAAAQATSGVESVVVTTLERLFLGELDQKTKDDVPPLSPLQTGVLPIGPLEVARLDNDPNFLENGRLRLEMRGGR
jgi:hypothetical protein